jgi:gluconolactonase
MSIEIDDFIAPNCGALYSLNNDLIVKKELTPISIGNGLAWNSEYNLMYYIDSLAYQIWSFNYDFKDGSISK